MIEGKDATEKEHDRVDPCQKVCKDTKVRKRHVKNIMGMSSDRVNRIRTYEGIFVSHGVSAY